MQRRSIGRSIAVVAVAVVAGLDLLECAGAHQESRADSTSLDTARPDGGREIELQKQDSVDAGDTDLGDGSGPDSVHADAQSVDAPGSDLVVRDGTALDSHPVAQCPATVIDLNAVGTREGNLITYEVNN